MIGTIVFLGLEVVAKLAAASRWGFLAWLAVAVALLPWTWGRYVAVSVRPAK